MGKSNVLCHVYSAYLNLTVLNLWLWKQNQQITTIHTFGVYLNYCIKMTEMLDLKTKLLMYTVSLQISGKIKTYFCHGAQSLAVVSFVLFCSSLNILAVLVLVFLLPWQIPGGVRCFKIFKTVNSVLSDILPLAAYLRWNVLGFKATSWHLWNWRILSETLEYWFC